MKIIKKCLTVILVLISTSFITRAQTTTIHENDNQKRFEKYITLHSAYRFYSNSYTFSSRIKPPSFSFVLDNKKKSMHEFKLNNAFYWNNQAKLGLGYQYKLVFSRNKPSKVKPYIGFGIDAVYESLKFGSIVGEKPNWEHNFYLSPYIAPGIIYTKNRFYLDVSIPIKSRINPNQGYSLFYDNSSRALDQIQLRIAAGIKLGKKVK